MPIRHYLDTWRTDEDTRVEEPLSFSSGAGEPVEATRAANSLVPQEEHLEIT
jgi:hypothetical protein